MERCDTLTQMATGFWCIVSMFFLECMVSPIKREVAKPVPSPPQVAFSQEEP